MHCPLKYLLLCAAFIFSTQLSFAGYNRIDSLNLVLKLSEVDSDLEGMKDAARQLSDLYEKENKYSEAFSMQRLYIRLRDSIRNFELQKTTLQKNLNYNYGKKMAADSVRISEEKKVTSLELKHQRTKRYGLYSGLLLIVIFALFMVSRFRLISAQKQLIESQKLLVEQQKTIVDEKQREILDSIHYAKRIQTVMMANEKYIDRILNKLLRS